MWEIFHGWIGADDPSFELSAAQMAWRAALVFAAALAIVRLGSKRFMGRNSAFDLIVAIMLGSVLSRAITGQSPFFPTLAAGAVLVALHSVLALLAARSRAFGHLIKGRSHLLVNDGQMIREAMRRHGVGEGDLLEATRAKGLSSLAEVEQAHLERNGEISIRSR
jgi:uncharacterized membrane protein YcaP (DUF421 family)